MADTSFVDGSTITAAAWFNALNDLYYTTLGGVVDTGAITKVQFPATQVPSADANALDDYEEGSFTATLTGGTTSPTYTAYVTKVGNKVTLEVPTVTVTSNATTKTLTGMPAAYRPVTQKSFMTFCIDAGGANLVTLMQIETSGVITLYPTASGGNWTASGTMTCQAFSVTYTLV